MINNRPVWYMQTDKKWANHPYATKYEKATIRTSGCGPTSAAMVLATWVDPSITPVTTCDWSVKHGYKATNNGTYHSYFVAQFKAYGITCEKITGTAIKYLSKTQAEPYHKKAHDAVDDGCIVICLMGPGNWTTGGHYIVWYDNDGDDVLINDPASTKESRHRNKFSLLKAQVGHYWIIHPPKEVISMKNSEVEKLVNDAVAKAVKNFVTADTVRTIADQRIVVNEAENNKASHGGDPADWAKKAWDSAKEKGLMDGTDPKRNITRQEVAVILDRIGAEKKD